MQSIREDIDKEHQEIQSTDIIMFFSIAEFVTSYQYHKCITSKVICNWWMELDFLSRHNLHSVFMVLI